jgi:hypothetical protein
LAVRADLADAIARPAQSVRRIILTRQTRQTGPPAQWQPLSRRYPHAQRLELLGPLCRLGPTLHPTSDDLQRCHWHQWRQFLPGWLRVCGVAPEPCVETGPTSVAVMASALATADPLMDLVVSCGATAIWCRQPDPFRVRRVDAVWWDDSVTRTSSGLAWQRRIAACTAGQSACQHVWLTNAPRREDYHQATQAGVSIVLAKPFDIDVLRETLIAPTIGRPSERTASRLRA